MWECGLKQLYYCVTKTNILWSLLMWECGLKQMNITFISYIIMSLLMWECGLKRKKLSDDKLDYCHSLCGSVD